VDKIKQVRSISAQALENFPTSEKVAKSLITLPTHPYMDEETMDKAKDILRENL
jgi:dTDP-4-amino-4,6-dideoxygalactose transaminase